MRYVLPTYFAERLESLPQSVQKKFWKQLGFLLSNIRHPSLRTKKYDETRGTWQARVDRNYRFYFVIEKDTYVLLDITPHPET